MLWTHIFVGPKIFGAQNLLIFLPKIVQTKNTSWDKFMLFDPNIFGTKNVLDLRYFLNTNYQTGV